MTDGGSSDGGSNRILVITLCTVLPVVGIVIIASAAYLCVRHRRLKQAAIFNRGVTPIDDAEIETWKRNQESEKDLLQGQNHSSSSHQTHRRGPSLIQYQNRTARPSYEAAWGPMSPRSFSRKTSFDIPQLPPSAVLARAPNAREGLTDETIPGDDPFIAPPRRQPSKLLKAPQNPGATSSGPQRPRVRGSRSSSLRSYYRDPSERLPRSSTGDPPVSRGHSRGYSTPTTAPRFSASLSRRPTDPTAAAPPLHRDDIGRAIG